MRKNGYSRTNYFVSRGTVAGDLRCALFSGRVGLILCVASGLHAEEPFDYFTNSWAVVGLKDYEDATRASHRKTSCCWPATVNCNWPSARVGVR